MTGERGKTMKSWPRFTAKITIILTFQKLTEFSVSNYDFREIPWTRKKEPKALKFLIKPSMWTDDEKWCGYLSNERANPEIHNNGDYGDWNH